MSFQPKLKKPPVYDRQKSSKRPLSRTVTVFLDDSAVEGLTKAQQDLAAAEARRDGEKTILARLEATEADPGVVLLAVARVSVAEEEVEATEQTLQALTDDLMENHAASFRLESIGRKAYDRIVIDHPASDEQKAEAIEGGGEAAWDPETFPPALLHRACVEPKMALWEWKAIFDWDLLSDEELCQALGEPQLKEVPDRTKAVASLREESPEWNMSELLEITQAAIEVCTHRRVVSLGKAYG